MYYVSRLYRRCGSRVERLLLRQVLVFRITAPCFWGATPELNNFPLYRLLQATKNLQRKGVLRARSLSPGLNVYILSNSVTRKLTGASRSECEVSRSSLIKQFAKLAVISRRLPEYRAVKPSQLSIMFGSKVAGLPDGFMIDSYQRKLAFLFLDINPSVPLIRVARKARSTVRRLAKLNWIKTLVRENGLDFVLVSSTRLRLRSVTRVLRSYTDMQGVPLMAVDIPELWMAAAPPSRISMQQLYFLWA